jgi:prepilin-type N-terminal cleavage/methylation domain-containing protein
MKQRRGISLIEVLVAVTLLGMMATVHTVVTLRYALRNRVAAVGVNRASAISSAVDLYSTMPFTAVSTNTGCTTINDIPQYRHTRCATTTAIGGNILRVRVIITPTNTALRPDTVFVDRARPPAGSLFS